MTDREVHPADAEKVYGALSSMAFFEMDDPYQTVVDDPEPLTPEELNPPFNWGDYLEDCLDYLVEEYDGVEKWDDGYVLTEIEQEKHLEREKKWRG